MSNLIVVLIYLSLQALHQFIKYFNVEINKNTRSVSDDLDLKDNEKNYAT